MASKPPSPPPAQPQCLAPLGAQRATALRPSGDSSCPGLTARGRRAQQQATEMQLKAWMVSGLAGDSQSHVALLRAVRPLLGSFFGRRLCSDAAAVEDLVQDVLVAVHERRGSYDRARPFLPWLYAIARYKWIDHLRQTHHHEPIEDLKDILEAEAFEPRSEARLDVASLLRRLPVKQARAIRHTRLQELSVAEAGRLAGIGESDVKVSAHRGIRTLIGRIAAAAA